MNYIVELQKALDYIEDNLEEEINYEKIAKELGISSQYVSKVLKGHPNYKKENIEMSKRYLV